MVNGDYVIVITTAITEHGKDKVYEAIVGAYRGPPQLYSLAVARAVAEWRTDMDRLGIRTSPLVMMPSVRPTSPDM